MKDLTKSCDEKTFFHNYLLISLIEQNDEMGNALQIMISENDAIIAIKLTDLEMPPEWSLSMKIIPLLFNSQSFPSILLTIFQYNVGEIRVAFSYH